MGVDQALDTVVGNWQVSVNQAFFALTVAGALVTALIIAFFLVRDGDHINDGILTRFVTDDDHDRVASAGRRAGDALQGYIRATVIIGALDAIFIGAALFALDVPLAGPLAVVTFLGDFFPVVAPRCRASSQHSPQQPAMVSSPG